MVEVMMKQRTTMPTMIMMMMIATCLALVSIATLVNAQSSEFSSANFDQFNYRATDQSVNNDYGPEDWSRVRCNDFDTCVRAEKYEIIFGFSFAVVQCHFPFLTCVFVHFSHHPLPQPYIIVGLA
jgi:hypothetical protein